MTSSEAKKAIADANWSSLNKVAKVYDDRIGGSAPQKCRRLQELAAERLTSVQQGDAPAPFGDFDRDDIARIISIPAVASCVLYEIKTSPDLDLEHCNDWRDAADASVYDAVLVGAIERRDFIVTYGEYLHTAASFAKSLGAVHTMRLYLRAWGLVQKMYFVKPSDPVLTYGRLDAKDALQLVRLEQIAARRLWLDVEAARLPPFKPRPKPAVAGKPKQEGN